MNKNFWLGALIISATVVKTWTNHPGSFDWLLLSIGVVLCGLSVIGDVLAARREHLIDYTYDLRQSVVNLTTVVDKILEELKNASDRGKEHNDRADSSD